MKNRKAPGIDFITAEVLKADGDPMVAMLPKIFNTVYDTEKTPKDWAQIMVILIHKKRQANAREQSRNITTLHPWQRF